MMAHSHTRPPRIVGVLASAAPAALGPCVGAGVRALRNTRGIVTPLWVAFKPPSVSVLALVVRLLLSGREACCGNVVLALITASAHTVLFLGCFGRVCRMASCGCMQPFRGTDVRRQGRVALASCQEEHVRVSGLPPPPVVAVSASFPSLPARTCLRLTISTFLPCVCGDVAVEKLSSCWCGCGVRWHGTC